HGRLRRRETRHEQQHRQQADSRAPHVLLLKGDALQKCYRTAAASSLPVRSAFNVPSPTLPSLIVPLSESPLTFPVTLMSSGLPFSISDPLSFTSPPLTVPLPGVSRYWEVRCPVRRGPSCVM